MWLTFSHFKTISRHFDIFFVYPEWIVLYFEDHNFKLTEAPIKMTEKVRW